MLVARSIFLQSFLLLLFALIVFVPAFAQGAKARCQLSAMLMQQGGGQIDSASQSVVIGQTAAFSLKDGAGGMQRVQVQPHQFGHGRVKATIDWQDSRGRSVVSTQMGMANGERIALAAEGVGKGPVVLNLRVLCR